MNENPYAAPNATIAAKPFAAGEIAKVYTPKQVAAGAFLGGPIGLVYFLKSNFRALGDDRRERNALIYGAIFVIALSLVLPLLPDKFPSAPLNLAYIFFGHFFAARYQMDKQAIAASSGHDFHSNWRVVGLGLLCGVASVIVIVGVALLLSYLGLLPGWPVAE
ncbi:MAG TPA: hypothetical protein VJ806_14280 [Luteimonas sp.]|nr:hypothetical protein [Luteimonas sp.]